MRNYPYSIQEGWDHLVKPLIQFVESNGGKVTQVKEKFGGLRFYYAPPLEADEELWKNFEDAVHAAEVLSTITCEVTGNYGELRDINGWWRCLSDEEYKKIIK